MNNNELTNDMVSVVATITDSVLEGVEVVPIAGKVVTIGKAFNSARAALFERKVTAFWGEFQNPKINKTLLANVYTNFRNDYGADYFDEALFNAIEKSDSVKRTKMISRLIILCSLDKIPQDEFWPVLHALQNLMLSDLKVFSNHYGGKPHGKFNPGFQSRAQSYGLLKFSVMSGAGSRGSSSPSYQFEENLPRFVGQCAAPYIEHNR